MPCPTAAATSTARPHPSPTAATAEERDGARARSARHCSRSEEHTSELQSQSNLVCRPLPENKKQRLKLATLLGEKGGAYVPDEPTTALHLADVEQLLALLSRPVASGKSLIVIDHHQALMAH